MPLEIKAVGLQEEQGPRLLILIDIEGGINQRSKGVGTKRK
jgi:hypothetical protein